MLAEARRRWMAAKVEEQLAANAVERATIQQECDAMRPPYTPAQTKRREKLMTQYHACEARDIELLEIRRRAAAATQVTKE